MSDEFPVPELIYDRRILVDGSMVYVDKKGIVVGVAVSGDFPNGIVIGQQVPPQPPTTDERIASMEDKQRLLIKAVDATKLTNNELEILTTTTTIDA